MEQQEYISSVIYEGLLYGSGLAIIPFLLDYLSSQPQSSHYGYMASLATLGAAFHMGAFVGKFFSYGFKNCLSYYNTHFVDFFCILALVIFGFSANITWLFIGRIGVGFMAGIQGKVSSVSALLFTDYASYELSLALSTLLFSALYWDSVDNLFPDSKHDIPAATYFTNHQAALGTIACVVFIFLGYVIYFLKKHCWNDDREGYIAISEMDRDLDRSHSRRHSRSYHSTHEEEDPSTMGSGSIEDSTADLYNNVPERYLRGCKMDLVEARRRWHLTLDWRREENVDSILEEAQPNFFKIKECYPHYFHNWSKDGHPVYYERVGYVDRKKMKSYGITVPMLVRHYVFITEYCWGKLHPDEDRGSSISIMDVENVGIRDLMGETLEFLTLSSKIIQGHYVERCHKIFVVNAPFFFNAVWKAVQPMVHENTRRKISILGSDRSELFECIDASKIPVAYGGTGGPLGSSQEEADLFDFVKVLNSTEQMRPFASTASISTGPPSSVPESSNDNSISDEPATLSANQAETRNHGGYMNYFNSAVSSVMSSIKENAASAFGNSESGEAFLGSKNEYVYDEAKNAWVLHSKTFGRNSPDDSPVFDPRESRSGAAVSRETSSSSVVAPLLGRDNRIPKVESQRKDMRRTALSPSAISTLLSRHRQEKGPQPWEFTGLCVALLCFQAVLTFVLELIPVWLYLPNQYGGWNFSVANVGIVLSASAFIAASGLYLAGYPKHIVYTPVCTRMSDDGGRAIAIVQMQGQERFRESRTISSTINAPHHLHSTASMSSLANFQGGTSSVSLQSLFWLGMMSEFLALLCAVILLRVYFRDVSQWPTAKNFCFHALLCGIVSSTIFSLAAVYECLIVTKKASVLSSSQDMKLTLLVSLATIVGSFMGPVVLYLLNVPNHYSPASVGTHAFMLAEVVVFILCLFCYVTPPKYPLYFYS